MTQLADVPITRRWLPMLPERLQPCTLGIADFPHVTRVMESFLARPAVQRGMQVP